MTIDDKIRVEKLQCYINRGVAKISALPLGTIDWNEYLTGDKILTFDQSRMIGQAKAIEVQCEKRK